MKTTGLYIRSILIAIVMYAVYRETGPFTVAAFILFAVVFEIVFYLQRCHLKLIKSMVEHMEMQTPPSIDDWAWNTIQRMRQGKPTVKRTDSD